MPELCKTRAAHTYKGQQMNVRWVHSRDSHPGCGVRGFSEKVTCKLRCDQQVGINLRKNVGRIVPGRSQRMYKAPNVRKCTGHGAAAEVLSGGLRVIIPVHYLASSSPHRLLLLVTRQRWLLWLEISNALFWESHLSRC